MKKLSVLSVLILTLNFVFGQEIPISIVDRLNSVNFIFEGTVIHSEAYYNSNGTYIYTSNTVEISRILKGGIECGTIEIITYGGQVGGESIEVSHTLQLIEGSMGIFLCDETDSPLSIVDFYPETNVEKLEATFENQSFIRYWWDGQGINAADLWLNYDSLAAIWNAKGDNLYWQHSPVLGIPYYFFKRSLYNSTIDTIMRDGDAYDGRAKYSDISIDNILLTNTSIGNELYHLAYSEIDSISFSSIINTHQVFSTDYIRHLTWSNDSQSAYFTIAGGPNRGLYKLNVQTKDYIKLLH